MNDIYVYCILFVFLINVLLVFNLCIAKFTAWKCKIHWENTKIGFNIFPELHNITTIDSEASWFPKKKPYAHWQSLLLLLQFLATTSCIYEFIIYFLCPCHHSGHCTHNTICGLILSLSVCLHNTLTKLLVFTENTKLMFLCSIQLIPSKEM